MDDFRVMEVDGLALVVVDVSEQDVRVVESFGGSRQARAEADAMAAELNAVLAAASTGPLLRYA